MLEMGRPKQGSFPVFSESLHPKQIAEYGSEQCSENDDCASAKRFYNFNKGVTSPL